MQTVILTIHILACIALIGLVLVQKSEGGGLGLGGGGGANSIFSSRGTAGAITRTTMMFGGLFVVTSLILTGMANHRGDLRTDVEKAIGVEAPKPKNENELFDPTSILNQTPATPQPSAPPVTGETLGVTPAPSPSMPAPPATQPATTPVPQSSPATPEPETPAPTQPATPPQ
jgi:preprotein translocase subunit SecG